MTKVFKSPDDVCSYYSKKNIKLTLDYLKSDNHFVLIKGDRNALRFLGSLLIAQAEFKNDSSFFISPRGPGNKLFSKKSRNGLYILIKENK